MLDLKKQLLLQKNKIIPLILFGGGLIFLFLFLKGAFNPYQTVLRSGTDDQYNSISFFYKILSKDNFSHLIDKLIESKDVRTINSVSFFCNEKVLCEKVPILEQQILKFQNYPRDTTWVIKINSSTSRESNRGMLDLPNSLAKNLEELKSKCR